MQRILARRLLDFTVDQLRDILTGEFILIFDDGELVVNDRDTIYSFYTWEFHQRYPKTELLMKHHIKSLLKLKNQRLSVDIDLKLLGNAMWSTYDAYENDPNVSLHRDLTKLAYDINNKTYVDMNRHTEHCMSSIDILDVMELLDHEEIYNVNRNIAPTPEGITHAYNTVSRVIRDAPELSHNPIVKASRSKLLRNGQVLQCITARGAATDMDDRIFEKKPITRSFGEGIRGLGDSMMESRNAAKSSFLANEMLKDSEYFSRRLQFIAQTVQHLHKGDCGSTRYLPWTIRKKQVDEHGRLVVPHDLMLLNGKNYVDDAGVMRTITPDSVHLIGKIVNLRSSMFCNHPDPVGICSTCFGKLAVSVPDETNIGQLTSTYMAKQASQNLLSNKHLDSNAVIDKLKLDADEMRFVRVGENNSSLLLAGALQGKRVKIIISKEEGSSMSDIFNVEEVDMLALRHVTQLTAIAFEVTDGPVTDSRLVTVSANGRLGSFTYPMLNFLKQQRWTIRQSGDYEIDMVGWNWDEPFIVLPPKHFNYSEHVDQIAKMLESRVTEMSRRDKSVSPVSMIYEFYDYVNWKLDVCLACLEVILYSTMIVSAEDNDYSLPKLGTKQGFSVHALTMANRSLSVAMAYQHQADRIMHPNSYLDTNRVDHIFDSLLMPFEVHGQQ